LFQRWDHELLKVGWRVRTPGGIVTSRIGSAAICSSQPPAELIDRSKLPGAPQHGIGHLPVERPRKFHLIVNMKTAKALDLAIPLSIVVRAD